MDKFIPNYLKKGYEECRQIAATHYENFPVASLLLPRESRSHIAALYAFARTADDYADEDKYKGRRLREINRWDKGLRAALKAQTSPAILQAFAHTLKTFQIPLSLPLNLLKAYRMDLTQKRYKTWKDILYYCKHSANPVGRMVLYISGIREEKLHRYSDFICTGLQLINFWQDTAIDLGRNRIYYPQAELKKAGVLEKDLLALKDSPAVRILAKNALAYTDSFFQRGYPLLNQVSGRLRLELCATYWGGQGILNKIRKMDYNVLENRPVWTVFDKVKLVVKALLG
ncbi:MAG TPA: squalene synthase HpnC [bacterium]|nr:squalene synthase HpnC [bacterium]